MIAHSKRRAILRDQRDGYSTAASAKMRGVTIQLVRAVRAGRTEEMDLAKTQKYYIAHAIKRARTKAV